MPRLGQESDDLRRRGQQQGQGNDGSGGGGGRGTSGGGIPALSSSPFASLATAQRNIRVGDMNIKLNFRNIAFFIVGIFILRNLLFNDYRKESIDSLKSSGMNDEEIDRIVPKTHEERVQAAKDKKNDIGNMKHDIEYLMNEVDDLKKKGRESALGEMDQLHLTKRQAHEEQLLKDHPNFKPSNNRLRKTEDHVATS